MSLTPIDSPTATAKIEISIQGLQFTLSRLEAANLFYQLGTGLNECFYPGPINDVVVQSPLVHWPDGDTPVGTGGKVIYADPRRSATGDEDFPKGSTTIEDHVAEDGSEHHEPMPSYITESLD